MTDQDKAQSYLDMDLLRFTTAGSVDDGKSTLIGRLLYDSKAIFEDQLEAIEKTSEQRGDENVNLALLTDGLRAEREQGITIDVAYRYFAAYGDANRWTKVLNDSYDLLIGNQRPGSYIFTDWTEVDGTPKRGKSAYNQYALESIRVPWRLMWDYAWHGEQRAYDMLVKFMDAMIARSPTPQEIRQKYREDGSAIGSDTWPSTLGGICAGAMVDPKYQDWLDVCNTYLFSIEGYKDKYYHTILQIMTMQFVNGLYQP